MPRMKSLRTHRFADRQVDVGTEYEATDYEARLLVALGHAEVIADQGKSMQAEQPAARQKRAYKRRDITSQRETK